MIGSLRWRFFVVVWVLLVAGMVGLGTLLGRWGSMEINRVTSEARIERRLGDASRELAAAALLAGDTDSVTLVAALGEVISRDSLIEGAAVSDGAGNIVASTLPLRSPGELTVAPNGEFEFRRDEVHDGRRAQLRVVGQGRLVDPRDSLDPHYLVVIPRVQGVIHGEARESLEPGYQMIGRDDRNAVLATRIRLALVIGSILAALVTLAISGPLLGRVGELSQATERLRQGDLAARVTARGSDELGRLGASFNAMAARLETSETQRRQMVTDVAHELRTPLTNLVALLEAARDGVRPVDDELLAILQDETGLLNRLVDDLRDLALAEAGELTVARESVDVAVAVHRAAAGFDSRHRIVVQVPDYPVVVNADQRRLGQVLRNLIQNAVTHSPNDGDVRVVVTRDAERVTIAVTDRGTGIAPEHLPHIWERFYRVDPSRARATGGMGLGLSVAKRLVEAMDGTIAVESEVGIGSRFTVSLRSTSPR